MSAIDSRTEKELNSFSGASVEMRHYSLPTHSDIEGIKEFIHYTAPKVISFVHRGSTETMNEFESSILASFDDDIIIKQLVRNKSIEAFNLYDLIKEER